MGILKKLPSYDFLLKNAVSSFRRFPLTMLCAFLGTAVAVYLADIEKVETHYLEQKLLMISALGVSLSVALTFLGEKLKLKETAQLGLQSITVLFLVVYYFTLPDQVFDIEYHGIRFVILLAGFHFLVACLPYIGGKQTNGFWQYNKELFIKYLIATLFSNVLMYGLFIALAAGDHLFGMDIDSKRYPQLAFIVIGVIQTWIFLASLPKDLESLDTEQSYPNGLKIFAQYILMPLVFLYFFILISYEAKIIINWNWPKGWVSNLVLWYSVVGIFSLLLLNPIKEKSENKWIKVFSTWYYRLLVPLVVMLFLAVFERISQYGITESRYLVLGMAVGLSIVMLYFIFSKKRDIRIIPIVLTLIALISAYGPWSAFSISKNSQMNRLEQLMTANDILVDDKIQKSDSEISFDDRKNMSSIISYLVNRHGLETFGNWIDTTAMESLDTLIGYRQDSEIAELMGFNYISSYETRDGKQRNFKFEAEQSEIFKIDDYDYFIDFSYVSYMQDDNEIKNTYELNEQYYIITLDVEESVLNIQLRGPNGAELDFVSLSFMDVPEKLSNNNFDVPNDKMTLSVSGKTRRFDILIKKIYGHFDNEEPIITNLDMLIFITEL